MSYFWRLFINFQFLSNMTQCQGQDQDSHSNDNQGFKSRAQKELDDIFLQIHIALKTQIRVKPIKRVNMDAIDEQQRQQSSVESAKQHGDMQATNWEKQIIDNLTKFYCMDVRNLVI